MHSPCEGQWGTSGWFLISLCCPVSPFVQLGQLLKWTQSLGASWVPVRSHRWEGLGSEPSVLH